MALASGSLMRKTKTPMSRLMSAAFFGGSTLMAAIGLNCSSAGHTSTSADAPDYAACQNDFVSCSSSIRYDVCSNGFRPQNGCHPVGGGPGDADPPSGDCEFHTYASADASSGTVVECDVNQRACP